MKKRILSLLLVVVMLVSLFPASIFAHADTVTKKPFILLNGSAIPGNKEYKYAYSMPKTWTRNTSAKEGELPQVYFMGHTDPASSAQALWEYYEANGYEDGMRYFDLDVLPAVFRTLVEDFVYFDKAVEVVNLWLEEFLSAYSAIPGAKLDGMIVDLEYHGSHSHYITEDFLGREKTNSDGSKEFIPGDSEIFTRIQSNAELYPALRARLQELGFVFYNNPNDATQSELLSIMQYLKKEQSGDGYRYTDNTITTASNRSVSRSIWNQVMDEMERDAINEAVLVPLLKYFPDATLSDYQAASQHSYNETLVWNGLAESYNNIYPAGNATNMNAYSGRAKATPDGYIGNWSVTAFNSALFEVKFAKDALAVSQDFYGINKQHIEVAGYSYGRLLEYKDDGTGELAGTVYQGAYSETPYYTETMLHLGLATDEPFMGYIIDSEETKKQLEYGGVGYQACIEIFEDILAELTRVAGYSDRKPLRTAANWNGSYILSGMYAGGRNIWRLSPDTAVVGLDEFNVTDTIGGGKTPTFQIDGLTITFPGGKIIKDGKIKGYEGQGNDRTEISNNSCGYWIETSADVEPVITATAGRYTGKTIYSETADSKTIAADEIYHKITMYDALNGRVVTSTADDTDYRIVWVNNSAVNKKAIVKNNGVQIATFAAPAGQDGVFTGTVHSHDDVAVNLTVEYENLDITGNTANTDFNSAEDYIKNQTAHIYLQGHGDVIIDKNKNDVFYFKYVNGAPTSSDAENYNVMFKFSEQTGIPTLYLKGAEIKDSVIIGKQGCGFFDLDIVVEENSSIITTDTIPLDASNLNGSITFTGTGKLTLQTGGLHAIKSTAKLVFKDADVDITSTKTGDGTYNYAAVWVKGANIVVDGGELNVTAAGGACLWIGEINGVVPNKNTINIKNKAQVTVNCGDTRPAIACGSKTYVNDAYLSVTSAAGKYFASSEPVVSNAHAHAAVNNTVIISNSFTKIGENKNATCTVAGSAEGLKCNHCGDVYKAAKEIPALDHKEAVRYEYVSAGVRTKITYCVNCDVETAAREEITVSTQTVSFKSYGYHSDPYYIGLHDGVWRCGITNTVSMNEGDADKYFTVKPISEENKNTVWYANGNVYNYNVRFSWPIGGVPTVYLKDANFYSNSTPLTITAGDLPVNIIVETDSSLTSVSEPYSNTAISFVGSDVLTITSRGNAKLTVAAEENVAIDAPGGLTLKDAYVVARGCAKGGNSGGGYASLRTGTASKPADFIVDNSTVDIYAYGNSFVKYAQDIKVINGSYFTAKYLALGDKTLDAPAITHNGDFMISSSTVKIYANSAFTGYHTESHIMLKETPVMIGVTAKAGSWTGYNLTGTTYKADYERIVALATPFQENQIDLYTYFETTPCEHKADPAAEATRIKCKDRAICVDCGLAFGELEEHTYDGVLECTENITCTACNAVVNVAKEHVWVKAPAVAATCTQAGLTEGYFCSVCDALDITRMQTIVSATGHKEVIREAEEAGCDKDGKTQGVQCETCGEWIIEQQTIKGGHTRVEDPAVAATCTTPGLSAGAHCSVCYTVLDAQEVDPPLGHTAGAAVKEFIKNPTCTETGTYQMVTYCTVCKDELSRTEVSVAEKTPHKLMHSVVDGMNRFTCAECGYVENSMTYDYKTYATDRAYVVTYRGSLSTDKNIHEPLSNAPKYYFTENGYVVATNSAGVTADEYNYNIKLVYNTVAENEDKLFVYLRGTNINYNSGQEGAFTISPSVKNAETGEVFDFACEIITESASVIESLRTTLNVTCTDGLIFRSVNDAKLTLKVPYAYSGSSTLVARTDVTFNNANVELNACTVNAKNVQITGDLNILNSKVKLNNNNGTSYVQNAIVLSDKSAEDKSNILIQNSFVESTQVVKSGSDPAFKFNGTFTIERSDVEILSNNVAFKYHPYIVENTHNSLKKAGYAQGSRPSSTTDYTGYTPGDAVLNNYTVGYFRSIHTCLAGTEWYSVMPANNCAKYMDVVNHCVICGADMNRTPGTEENGAALNTVETNPNWAEHTPGTPVEVERVDATKEAEGYVVMATPCAVCGVEMSRETQSLPIVKKAYVSAHRYAAVTLTNNDKPVYWITNENGEAVTEGANANNYNIKLVYSYADDMVYIYLKDAFVKGVKSNNSYALTIGSTTDENLNNFACKIIVESDSELYAYGSNATSAYAVIKSLNADGLTIESKDYAKLTLSSTNYAGLLFTANDLLLKNANVSFTSATTGGYNTMLWVKGDLTFEDSMVNLHQRRTETMIHLSDNFSSNSATPVGMHNFTIRNSIVTSTMNQNTSVVPINQAGYTYIYRSDVSFDGNTKLFSTAPYVYDCNTAYWGQYGHGTNAYPGTKYTPGGSASGFAGFDTTHTCGGGAYTIEQNTEKPCCGVLDKYTACVGWKTVKEIVDDVEITRVVRCDSVVKEVGAGGKDPNAAAHTFTGEWQKEQTVAPTASTSGEYVQYKQCSVCGEKKYETVSEDSEIRKTYIIHPTKTAYFYWGGYKADYSGGTEIKIANDGEMHYYTVEGNVVTKITDPALYKDYHLRVWFPTEDENGNANATAYLYMRGLNYTNTNLYYMGLTIGNTDYVDFACQIIVESASSILGSGNGQAAGAIYALNKGGLTISSQADALLTLSANNAPSLGSIACDLTLMNANLKSTFTHYSNIWVKGDMLIENSTVVLGQNAKTSPFEILLSDSYSTLTGNAYDLTIKNSDVTTVYYSGNTQNVGMLSCKGNFLIYRSDVNIQANKVPFYMTPTIDQNATAAYGQYAGNAATTAYTYQAGQVFTNVHTGYMGSFKTTHSCGDDNPELVAPTAECAEFYNLHYVCECCGADLGTVTSTEHYGDPEAERPAHVSGETIKEGTGTTYDLVTYCVHCFAETSRETVTNANANKQIPVTFDKKTISVYMNDEFVYYSHEENSGTFVITTEAAGNYNIKMIFRSEENRLYIYFKGFNYTTTSTSINGFVIGSADVNDFNCTIITEANSTIFVRGDGGEQLTDAVIYSYISGQERDLTFKSVGTAKLTLELNNYGSVLASKTNTYFVDANVDIFPGGWESYAALNIQGNMVVERSNLKIQTTHYAPNTAINLSDNYKVSAGGAATGVYSMTVRNSTLNVDCLDSGSTAITFGGDLIIDRSTVTVSGKSKAFIKAPATLTNVTVTAGTPTSATYTVAHVHGGGATVAGEDPVASCSPYMGMKEYCAFPGCNEYSIVADKTTSNTNATAHGATETVKGEETVDENTGLISYNAVKYCTACGTQISTTPCTYSESDTISVAFNTTSTKIDVLKNDEFVYYTVSAGGAFAKLTGDTSKYNFKVIYRNAEGRLYIYLKGIDVSISGANEGLIVGTAGDTEGNKFACTITVEAASSIVIYGNSNYRAAIYAYNTNGLTITSVNNALLDLGSTNSGIVMASYSDTTFANANVNMNNAGHSAKTGLYVDGDLLVENSTLKIWKDPNKTGGYGGQTRAILLSESMDNLSGTHSMTVRNSKLYAENLASNNGAISFGGTLEFERSDVELHGYNYTFTKAPFIKCNDVDATTWLESDGAVEDNYDTFAGKEAGTDVIGGKHYIKDFNTIHAHGGGTDKVKVETIGDYCTEMYDVYSVSCVFPGCETDGTVKELASNLPTEHTWDMENGEVTDRLDATATTPGYIETTYRCTVSGCTGTKVVREELDVLESTYFQYYSPEHILETVVVAEGKDPLYFESVLVTETSSKDSTAKKDVYYLTPTNDTENWNVKLVYVDGIPTMYIQNLTLNNRIGLVFGGTLADYRMGDKASVYGDTDLNVVVMGDQGSTISKVEDTGEVYNNSHYYQHPAMNFLTTGKTTITSVDGAQLTLYSDNQLGTNGATIMARGDLVLQNANIVMSGTSAWSEPDFCISVLGGDFVVSGGNLSIVNNSHVSRFFLTTMDSEGKRGNIIIRDAANIDAPKNGADATHFSNMVQTDGKMTVYNDCTVNIGSYGAYLFNKVPEVIGYCSYTKVTEENRTTIAVFTVTPATCAHASLTAHAEVLSTCSTYGRDAYWKCDTCGDIFADAEATMPTDLDELTKTELADHGTGTWAKIPGSGQDATCMESGYYKMQLICQYCGADLGVDPIDVEIPPLSNGHEWEDVPNSMIDATYKNLGTRLQRCTVDGCDATQTVYAPAKFYGTNVDLGNSLNINFYFYAHLENVNYEGAYALFTRTYANAATEVTRVDREDWKDNRDFFQLTYSDIAAKEMGDSLSVMVYDKDGNVIVAAYDQNKNIIPKTTSVKDYLHKMLGTQTEKNELSTLLVDTLNYGAAMQSYFEYDDSNLVNAILDQDEKLVELNCKSWATDARDLNNVETNFQKSSNKYFGTSFVMSSNISMNMYVAADVVGVNGYAKVSFYTKGNESNKTTYTIEEFTTVGRYAIFNLDNAIELAEGKHALIPAKSDVLMTFEFYDGAKNKVVTVANESVLEYMARWNNSYAVSIMQFMDGAKSYFAH